jgi:hypothetical protein
VAAGEKARQTYPSLSTALYCACLLKANHPATSDLLLETVRSDGCMTCVDVVCCSSGYSIIKLYCLH